MKQHNNAMELLGSAPIPKALLAMGLPIMIGMLINALYNLADAYFVLGLGQRQMGAISIVFPLGQAVVGLGLLFGSGAASCLSRLLGRGARDAANEAAATALYGSLLTGAALILPAALFLRPILELLGATGSILPDALVYGRIYLLSSILNVFNVAMNSMVSSEGAAKTAMCALLAGALLNVVLDPLLIYGLDLGVAGAAIATAVSQAVSAAVYLGHLLRGKSVFRFRPGDCRFRGGSLPEILKIGAPTLAFQLLTSLSIALVNRQARPFGDSVIAGMGVVTRIVSMGSLVVFGFLKGLQPIAGYSFGAKKYGRLREAVRTALLWSTVFCALFACGMLLFPQAAVSRVSGGDPVMTDTVRRALRANGLSFLLFGFSTVYAFLYPALGKAAGGLVLGALRQGICFVPAILLLPALLGVRGILYAQPAADVIAAAVTAGFAARLHRSLKALAAAEAEDAAPT